MLNFNKMNLQRLRLGAQEDFILAMDGVHLDSFITLYKEN